MLRCLSRLHYTALPLAAGRSG